MEPKQIKGQLIDLHNRAIYPATVVIAKGKIEQIKPSAHSGGPYIMPGFIDAHVHIESAMLTPSAFARIAVRHGTVATISDPHEIANVLGVEGVEYMIEDGLRTPFHFFFGAPSCVPATAFETAGATIGPAEIKALLDRPEVLYLAEMMNYPGVLHQDEGVMAKIAAARQAGKPIDGHAPGLRGEAAEQYFAAGITTDHECYTYEEGREKALLGVNILIREGSAAKNYQALAPLIKAFPSQIMFCSDDKHPDDLLKGHINTTAARAIQEGYDFFDVLRAACIHPIDHYRLPVGQLREGDPADFILVEDLERFTVRATFLSGACAFSDGACQWERAPVKIVNQFSAQPIKPEQLQIPEKEGAKVKAIRAHDGELITSTTLLPPKSEGGFWLCDPGQDLLKIAVCNRYKAAPVATAFITGTGIKKGAIASCVAHDSHNIIAIGADDESICRAVNLIVRHKGGISAAWEEGEKVLPLPIAGIMSEQDGEPVAKAYQEIDEYAKTLLGSTLSAPFMTLSFMGLLVIPQLKMSDLGLFDGQAFRFTEVWQA
ncbi:adenine deaminase [Phaeodactylibacter luteus]|uniref:Adenine deaminase n=1 Tax=Phaeodactylibacter luteus TaxID=1564516 RepID=A0A5C6S4E0_9BACT|nr:adenine deaminase [Phaeodactylibacter luteus]TXB69500.1 adenine deaminase [Phaeodactylibacter luteus]